MHLYVAINILGEKPCAHGEHEEVEGQVEHGGVHERIGAEDGREHRIPDEPDIAEAEHEPVHAPAPVGNAQKQREPVGRGEHDKSTRHGKPQAQPHFRLCGQLSGREHRAQDHARQRNVDDQLREHAVELVVHEAQPLRGVAHSHDDEQRDDLLEYAYHALGHGAKLSFSDCGTLARSFATLVGLLEQFAGQIVAKKSSC